MCQKNIITDVKTMVKPTHIFYTVLARAVVVVVIAVVVEVVVAVVVVKL